MDNKTLHEHPSVQMNVAVFGANGYVGQHMVAYLQERLGHEVTGFGLQDSFKGKQDIRYHRIDITDRAQIDALSMRYDAIYFFAGLTGVEVTFEKYERYLDVNEKGLLHLLNRIRHSDDRPKVIFPSTRLVYKGVEGAVLAEDAEKKIKSIYASTKYNGELYLDMYRNLYGVDYSVFRVSVPYGNTLDTPWSYGTLSAFIQQAKTNGVITLYGDGSLTRTFTHIEDVCRQIIIAGRLPQSSGECYNVDGEAFSLREVAEAVIEKYGGNIQYTDWPGKSLQLESGHTVFDCRKIQALLSPSVTHSLKAWIGE